MSQFENEVRNSIKELSAAITKVEKSSKAANNSLKKNAENTKKWTQATKRQAKEMDKVNRKTVDMRKRFGDLGQGVSQVGGSVGGLGGQLSSVVGMTPGLGALTAGMIAFAGAAAMANAHIEKQEKQLQNIITLGQQARDANQANAAAGQPRIQNVMMRRLKGFDDAEAQNLAGRGIAASLDDARAYQEELEKFDEKTRKAVGAAAQRASLASGQSLMDSLKNLEAYKTIGRGSAFSGTLKLDETSMAAAAAGLDVEKGGIEKFRRFENYAKNSKQGRALREYRGAATLRDLSLESAAIRTTDPRGGNPNEFMGTDGMMKQVDAIINPVMAANKDQLEVLNRLADNEAAIVALLRDFKGLFGGEGSQRSQANDLQNTMRGAQEYASY